MPKSHRTLGHGQFGKMQWIGAQTGNRRALSVILNTFRAPKPLFDQTVTVGHLYRTISPRRCQVHNIATKCTT